MSSPEWDVTFHQIYDQGVSAYRRGKARPDTLFNADQKQFLASIGCTPQELYDFVEDWCGAEEPPFETVLLITSVRRDFFLTVQKGKPSGRVISLDDLPPKDAEVEGFAWLPRIIVKARAKLRGEMPPDLMYGCGGDRPFLRKVQIHPADFLRVVWSAREDDDKVVQYVKQQAGSPAKK